jgi:hypothetical protein
MEFHNTDGLARLALEFFRGTSELGTAVRFSDDCARILVSSAEDSSSISASMEESLLFFPSDATSTGLDLAFSSTKFRNEEVAGLSFSDNAGI